MDCFDLREWKGFLQAGGDIAKAANIDNIVIDSRTIYSANTLFVALKGTKKDGHAYIEKAAKKGAKFALVSLHGSLAYDNAKTPPSITLLKVADPLQSFQEIVKTYRLKQNVQMIGITGSFGKTMVKDLLTVFLQSHYSVVSSPESFNSQIGVPLSLLHIQSSHQIAIIEAAISQKGEMQVLSDLIRPDFTILTPIGNKHLATLKNISTLKEELYSLIRSTSPSGWSLLPEKHIFLKNSTFPSYYWENNKHNSISLPHATALSMQKYQIYFPTQEYYEGTIEQTFSTPYFLNLLNMAIKAAWLLGISTSSILSTLKNYFFEPTRTEIWRSTQGYTFINDTYCSDPQSVAKSLQYFASAAEKERKIFIFGGVRNSSIEKEQRIGQLIGKANIDSLFLVGNLSYDILTTEVQQLSPRTKISTFSNHEELFNNLQLQLHTQDLILMKGKQKLPLEQLTAYLHDHLCHNQCIINLAAVQENIFLIQQKLPSSTRIMAIVKALAYGTDSVQIAKCLSNCGIDILGVSYVEEGVALKKEGITQSIFVLNAAPYEIDKVVKWELEIGINDKEIIDLVGAKAKEQNKIIKVHLHINTGMSRFGCRPEEALLLAKQILLFPSLQLEGIFTHFACADDPEEDFFTKNQIKIFDEVIATLEKHYIFIPWKHAANSSGVLRFHFPQYNMVRIGLAMFGLYLSDAVKDIIDLKLAFSLTSRIVGINTCRKGETVSYGRKYVVTKEIQRIAILPIGYFDGIHRHYSSKSYVLIHGQKAPMVGNICMDYMMIDITDLVDVSIGDRVLIFGEDEQSYYLSPEELAISGSSIIHELITCLGPRIQRIFIYEESKRIR